MEITFFKLFTLCLPFFCFLLTWASSTTTPSPSALTILHSSGYSRFARKLMSTTASNSFNATGTILAPPDFAFSFAAAKFNNHRHRLSPRPSTSLFLYHTIHQPLSWQELHTRAHGDELRTLFDGHCVFVSKTGNGDLSFTASRKSTDGVKIRHPNLYMDNNLAVHGVDGVLDPSFASKCSVQNPKVKIQLQIDRNLLDLAARALRKNGYYVAATALTIKSPDLMNLNGVTVFTPSDKKLFSFPDGFRYDFTRHVIPNRLRFADIARLPAGTVMNTINPNKTVVIGYDNGQITINGAILDGTEVYLNRWIVAISVSRTFDDGGDVYGVPSRAPTYSTAGENYGSYVPSVAPSYSGYNSHIQGNGVPTTAPIYSTTRLGDYKISHVSAAPSFNGGSNDAPSTAPVSGLKDNEYAVPSVAPSFSINSYDGGNNSPILGGDSDGVRSRAPIYSATGLEDYKIAVPSLAPSFSGYSNNGGDDNDFQGAVSSQVPSSAPIYSTTETYGSAAPSTAWRFSGDSKVSSPAELPASGGFLDDAEAGVPPAATDFSEESENRESRSSPASSDEYNYSPAVKSSEAVEIDQQDY